MSIWMLGAWAGLALFGCEMLVYAFAPMWLARFAWAALPDERRVTLPPPPAEGGYREVATVGLPAIVRVDLEDAVLVPAADGRTFALRRAFALGFGRQPFLVRIDLEREGGDVVMRPREGFVWASSIVLFAWILLFGMSGAHRQPMLAVGMGVGGLAGLFIGRARRIESRDAAIRAAFEHLERELRGANRGAEQAQPATRS